MQITEQIYICNNIGTVYMRQKQLQISLHRIKMLDDYFFHKFHYINHNLFIFRYINHNLFIYLLRTPCTQTSQDGSYHQELCLTLASNITERLRSTASVCFMYIPIPYYHLVNKSDSNAAKPLSRQIRERAHRFRPWSREYIHWV